MWTHYSWLLSPYSAKTRALLRYKKVAFDDVPPSATELYLSKIRPAVGRAIMPTARTPEGEWLQDSALIYDTIEERFPEPSTTPPGAAQQLASLLVELAADEWLTSLCLHYRWNLAGNAEWARKEFGRWGFPMLPERLASSLAGPIARKMQSYLPVLGISEATIPGIERFAADLIKTLDGHLASHSFLLGEVPCRGDFALFGPLWAHLYRDPHSRDLFDDAPHCRRWMRALHAHDDTFGNEPNSAVKSDGSANRGGQAPGEAGGGCFLPDDVVPSSLDPFFVTIFKEQWPFLQAVMDGVDQYMSDHPSAQRVPRVVGSARFCIGGAVGERKLLTFMHWKAQRPLRTFAALDGQELSSAELWLNRVRGLKALRRPPQYWLERIGWLPQEELRPERTQQARL
eukprot:TRINITY_DN92518_c0_g1_i1.p1 TRINITY_DN92518_c0_g1~~TRINITY_DN92518_c0_g1_i1.p1  ORF type:complete len:400 (-),score=39.74 TRINITY_DN92518_c0_g1_i1:372-1571(-)